MESKFPLSEQLSFWTTRWEIGALPVGTRSLKGPFVLRVSAALITMEGDPAA